MCIKLFWTKKEPELRQIIIYPGADGYWVVECPIFPGCTAVIDGVKAIVLSQWSMI